MFTQKSEKAVKVYADIPYSQPKAVSFFFFFLSSPKLLQSTPKLHGFFFFFGSSLVHPFPIRHCESVLLLVEARYDPLICKAFFPIQNVFFSRQISRSQHF